ncbi:membrane protein [Streptomyces sp. NBRC 14336]|uniref:EI24 domain-containing protein n=1 Tax=Streptomyces sp. NBRC 14336 TaxID=3030992 RepID=UPI0024A17B6D|nr:EI24 domain-containing protein [Streptomyces sp. NBRC 14336]WBO77738.1 EI24 domain-containing protein [Streptomyces sp. SBE_14.2]GLW51427.1 membrane protein [Streptomyces sp. NBRC 14336]
MHDLGVGFRYLLKGQRWMARHGKSYGFGLIPGLITFVLYAAALVALALWGDDLVAWATPFADDWSSPWLGLFRGFLTVLLFALSLLLTTVTFTAVTLLIGQPFYESLSEQVDRDVSPDGTAPESGLPLWRELWISGRDSLRIVVRAAIWGVLLFALGFVPVVGQTVVPVIGFMVTGYFLTEELTAVALQRREIELRDRLRLLRARRTLVWGFGTPLGVAFVVPFVAVFLMPGAVAGATLMARDLLGEEIAEDDDEDTEEELSPQSAGSPAPGR